MLPPYFICGYIVDESGSSVVFWSDESLCFVCVNIADCDPHPISTFHQQRSVEIVIRCCHFYDPMPSWTIGAVTRGLSPKSVVRRCQMRKCIPRRAKQDSGGHDIHGKFGGSLSFRPNFAVMSEAVKCYISEAWPTDRWVPDACARTCNLVRVQGST